MGVKEMVQTILAFFPIAIRDVNQDGKNVVLLAVENRQTSIYELLLGGKFPGKVSIFQQVDRDGNNVLHLAAKCKPWLISGGALQMQSEMKWYQFVKETVPTDMVELLNKKGQTDKAVFVETHKDLVRLGEVWLNNTTQSCSLVAALIATVAFATATDIPGGVKQETGTTTFDGKPALVVYSIASLIALCFSVTSLIMFLAIILAVLTSGYEEASIFARLITNLIYGLTSLFISIVSMLISFLASLSFVLKNQLNIAPFPVYAVTCVPIALSAVVLFPLYTYLVRSSISKVAQ